MAVHPVFGDISDKKNVSNSLSSSNRPKDKGVGRVSFATNSNTSAEGNSLAVPQPATQPEVKDKKCPLCKSNHWLSQCGEFKKMKLEDRLSLFAQQIFVTIVLWKATMSDHAQRRASAK